MNTSLLLHTSSEHRCIILDPSSPRLFIAGVMALAFGFFLFIFWPPCTQAGDMPPELSLFQHTESGWETRWREDGAFAEALRKDIRLHLNDYPVRQVNTELRDVLKLLRKKLKVTFSPKVIVKPFIVVERIQDLLLVYQSKKQASNIPIDEYFRAKLALLPHQIAHLKKLSQSRSFTVSPYYNRIYGLHLQIAW